MNNADVAAALGEIAELLELKGESSFRIRAYQNAQRTIGILTEDVHTLVEENRLQEQPGIGKGIADRVAEFLDTGHIQYLDDLRAAFPPGVRTLLAVPGVGPSLARRVYTELGVDSLEGLRQAAEDGRLALLPGLGEKSAQNVVRGLGRVNKRESRISIGVALPLVEALLGQLAPYDFIQNLVAAGSLRRWSPTIGDIDIMGTSSEPERAMEVFVNLPQVAQVLGHGPTKSAIVADNGLQVDFRLVEAEYFGSLLQHFTGSRDHNIELRDYALHRGQSLNEYGINNVKTGEREAFADEVSFYAALGLEWMPPEIRQGSGEIAAARTRTLPNLVTVEDIRGDLHAHTTASDGACSIDEMVEAARACGYEYMAITDHSPAVGVAGGLAPERLREQIALVRDADRRFNDIRVLAGSEVDIRRDGRLDYDDDLLAELDWVIASIHSGFNQTREQMTQRLLSAIENPHVDAIAHPTGVLIGKRAPYDVDLEAVFRAAARTGTVLEVNSHPERLDLVDTHVRRAIELGVTMVVNTDAHAPIHYRNIRYGVAMARRGWAEAGNVLNTRSREDLEGWLSRGAR